MPIHAAAFSPDGTIVVLVHGPVVTLWDVESNVLLKVLDAGRQLSQCLCVVDRYLVAAGTGVVVWDLLSCEVVWSHKSKVDHLIPYNTSFATTSSTSNKTSINIYHPSCPVSQTATIPISLMKVTSLRNEFIGVASSGEIYRFGQDVAASAPATNTVATSATKTSSIWQEMFGKEAFLDDLAAPQPTVVLPPTVSKPTDIFDGPSHTLPPVGLLFDAFMGQLLKPKAEKIADAGSDTIKYDEPKPKIERSTGPAKTDTTKKVSEDEMRDLESFFKQVLTSAPTTGQNGTLPKMANGDHTPKSTPVKPSSAVKGKLNGVAIPNDTPTDESRQKSHTKKRRAPKE
jgi:NET1-associated nuclear protein 1 (U3 small nucleolar RNA-associated protein 17)